MGQKVNPIGFRVTVNKNWDSRWFTKKANFWNWLHEDLKIRDFIKKKYYSAAIAKIMIERSANRVRIIIYTARPGLLIGPKGADLENLKSAVSKFIVSRDIIVDVKEIQQAELNAQLVAESICAQLERRIGFKRAMKKAIQTGMDLGALGVKVQCGGRLGGAELARTEQYKEGKVPLHTLRANIDYGFAEAHTTSGKIGVKVWMCHKEAVEETNNAVDAKKSKAQKSSARE
ncbi:MAG TPA: 30S ribosomal protein S3 [Lentisphaeria bacterium]|nr:MAG: 30S ribosomal protein S3 [Lentisphaerae bacterium GWF2_50_93]HCE43449.1 30S ribosomal protein S3 [Lentisphaeria bacterium]